MTQTSRGELILNVDDFKAMLGLDSTLLNGAKDSVIKDSLRKSQFQIRMLLQATGFANNGRCLDEITDEQFKQAIYLCAKQMLFGTCAEATFEICDSDAFMYLKFEIGVI